MRGIIVIQRAVALKNRVMLMIASDLSNDERKALANYYAGMTTPKPETAPAEQAVIAAGAKIAATGARSRTTECS